MRELPLGHIKTNDKQMKRIIIILTLITCSIVKGQNDYLQYPDYDLVITKFFNQYSIKDIPTTAQIEFEKRPSGWHVSTVDYSEERKTIKNQLFWDKEKNTFQKIDFEEAEDNNENRKQLDKFKNTWSRSLYRICPYYGYPGWDWDVIQAFEKASNLSDSTLYALGRAYSSFASNLLNNNSLLADHKRQFKLSSGKNCLTRKQLKQYRYYRHRAIEKFEQLTERNPKFSTIVGAIGTKAANEYLTSFLDLRMYQNEEEANKEISDGLYTDFYIAAAKNYLNSCLPNAILFTNGDNDTYPLLYVQSQYGFRTDVLVVNISLLNSDRYVNSLRQTILEAPALPISFTPDEIVGKKRNFIIIEKKSNAPKELSELISYLKNDKNLKNNYFHISSNKFSLQHPKNSIEWEVDKPYFLLNHLILLDMLAVNKWERPVYFAASMEKGTHFGLTDYFQLEGLAYQLVSTKKDESSAQEGRVNTMKMYDNLMHKFDWSGLHTISPYDRLFYSNYIYNFKRLVDALIKEKKEVLAEAVLDKCVDLMPNEIIYNDYYTFLIVRNYYQINAFEKGNNIAKKIVYNLKNDIGNFFDKTSQNKETTLQQFRDLAVLYKQYELIKEFEK